MTRSLSLQTRPNRYDRPKPDARPGRPVRPTRRARPARPARPARQGRPGRQGQRPFQRLSTNEVKRLSYDNRSIEALTLLWTAGVVLSAAVLLTGIRVEGYEGVPAEAQALVVLFLALTAIGCHRRESWARISGVFACLLMILSETLFGLLVGPFGLLVFYRSSRLFGPGRYDAHKLKYELEARTRYGIR